MPQVLAATLPIGALSNQVGTIVKLVRVLMLGPVVLVLSLLSHGSSAEPGKTASRPSLHHLVPWFIIGFLAMVAARSLGLVPLALVGPIGAAAGALTVLSMAALGLGVDIRVVGQAGPRVTAVVSLSLIGLGAIALLLLHALSLH